jgi:hypothetical protein
MVYCSFENGLKLWAQVERIRDWEDRQLINTGFSFQYD